ncbi:S-layer homology domain-containing protein [Cohnella fermenti]|uniref:S-layer homology domain-containing protein n=1 Tax=Cohnella fermenti TaxID=2565925 RepID=A0A4S4BLD0_9BACL|nr:S-layer homology domain-containing protein [Cohnella fermenti]THF73120.1 S-layer homology domain-containing protein [Cohnella fermenti]
MRRYRQHSISWMLIVALVVALLPQIPASSNAAASAYFQFNDFSTEISSPTEVNSNIIDVAGTFSNVASSSIAYKIEKLAYDSATSEYKAAESTVGSSRPIISGTSSFMFSGVTIYDGLNRITISGTNNSGNIVNAQAFVNFTNVPVISEVKLINGTALVEGESVVTANPTETLTLKAPNATEVTINGTQMFGGSGSSFVLSGIAMSHGLNKLTIIARNATKTYELTRYLIYYNGSLTAYDVKLGGYSLDGDPTISAVLSGAAVSGSIVLPGASPASTETFTVQLWESEILNSGSGSPEATTTVTGTLASSAASYGVYSFTTGNLFTVSTNGDYVVRIAHASVMSADTLPFTYLSDGSPYITGVKQAYNVTGTTDITYTSSANFAEGTTLTKLPIWIVLDAENFSTGGTNSLTIMQNGTDVTSSAVVAATKTSDGKPAYLISNLPAGQLKLTFTITDSGNSNSVVRNITYYPAPAIQIDNLYSGQQFTSVSDFATMSIMGKLLNFNLTSATELASLKVSLNGVSVSLQQTGSSTTTSNINSETGIFSFDVTGTGLTLVAGANTIVFSGTASGIPITTTLTLYLFSSDQPAITSIFPVPYIEPSSTERKFSDSAVKFAITDTNTYTTTEKKLDLLFKVMDFDDLEVQVNGVSAGKGTIQTNASVNYLDVTGSNDLYIENTSQGTIGKTYTLAAGETEYLLRLSGSELPTSGSTTYTIILHKGTSTVSQTITVIRDLSPYIVLSPKLPDEAVINANFLKVSIKAEGADQVLIGKVAMTKGEGDIFRYELGGLKSGKNTVKFTVVTGTTKLNGSFDVTYAADNSVGAQYKSSLASSGKISIFKGDLALSFPKNTYLRQANGTPGQDIKTTDLFNSQTLYFGVADRTDGRTVKKYNQVGETDSNGNYLDGTIKDVAADTYATDRLVPITNFSYSSSVYWIDAGYFDSTTSATTGEFTMVNAMLPYSSGTDMFYARVYYPEKWLEPSQRGEITIKYDSNIADVYAKNLSVWRYTNAGWTNVGGVVNTSSKTVTAPFDGFGYYVVMGLRYSMSDIIGHSYAKNALESMFAHGIMNNKDANSFGVYENITRGEFAQMVVKIMGVPLQYDANNMTFDDVLPYDFPDQPYWNYKYVETAVKVGYIRGKSPRLFFPNDPLTRAEAAVIIARALNLVSSNADTDKDLVSLQKIFTDASSVDYYAISSILAINKAGYITGIANTVTAGSKATYRFEPLSNLSRADAALIANRIMVKMKKL